MLEKKDHKRQIAPTGARKFCGFGTWSGWGTWSEFVPNPPPQGGGVLARNLVLKPKIEKNLVLKGLETIGFRAIWVRFGDEIWSEKRYFESRNVRIQCIFDPQVPNIVQLLRASRRDPPNGFYHTKHSNPIVFLLINGVFHKNTPLVSYRLPPEAERNLGICS